MAAGNSIIGGTELREDDYVKAWPRLPTFHSLRFVFIALFVVWSMGAIVTLSGSSRPVDGSVLVRVLPPLVFVVGMLLGLQFWVPHGFARRSIAALGGGRVTFRFDDAGLYFEAPARQFKLGWSALPQHVDVGDSFVIYTNDPTILVIPKRAFADAERAALATLLQERIPPLQQRRPWLRLLIWAAVLIFFLSAWRFLSIEAPPH